MNNASLELGGDNWAAKDGNLLGYAVGDSSGKYVPNEFTFTRGSNLSATRVNEDGYIEKGYENLLLQSNSFDTTPWNISNVTGGQEGYDGNNDAWLQSGASRLQQTISLDTGVYTFSLYLKAGYSNYCEIRVVGSKSIVLRYELTGNGSIITSSNVIDSQIQLIGNGWYKVSGAFDARVSAFRVYPKDDSSGSQSSSSSIYIQDAMINQGLAALPYIESGASTAKAGVLENEPRIDYSSGTASLLLEPQRTNNVTSSEYFQSGWNNLGSRVSFEHNTTDTLSPEGKYNATKLIKNLSGNPTLRMNAVTAGSSFVFTCWAKAGTSNLLELDISDTATTTFTLTNQWQRFEVKTSSASDNFVDISLKAAINIGEYVYVWGAQVEEGAYPTSYIPTYGVSQTRGEDSIENPIESQPLGQIGQGTWFVELQKIGDDTSSSLYLVPTLSNTQQIRLHFDETNARFRDAVNGYATIGGGVNIKTSMTKMALSIDTNSGIAKAYANGSQLGADYTLQSNTFEFSRIKADGNGFILKQSSFFPTALTDSECIELTTI